MFSNGGPAFFFVHLPVNNCTSQVSYIFYLSDISFSELTRNYVWIAMSKSITLLEDSALI